MGKVYTRFQTKTAQTPYPTGRHIPVYSLYKVVPPPLLPPGRRVVGPYFEVRPQFYIQSEAPNEDIVQNRFNIALLNVF